MLLITGRAADTALIRSLYRAVRYASNLERRAARNRKPIRYRVIGTTRYIVLVRTCANQIQNETSSTEYSAETLGNCGNFFDSRVGTFWGKQTYSDVGVVFAVLFHHDRQIIRNSPES